MRLATLSALALALAWPAAGRAGEGPEPQERFVVHEWGVQVRTRAVISSGIGFGPRPDAKFQTVLAAPKELISGLPPFVLRHEKQYTPARHARNWDKPVLHLYGRDGLEFSVKVLTAAGRPLAYWPKPQLVEETFWMMGSGVTDAVGLSWKGKLSGERPAGLPEAAPGHWWNTVREVPGRWLKTDGGTERFIFYEASAVQEPLVVGTLSAEELVLENTHAAETGPVVVIVNDGEERHFVSVPTIAGKAAVKLARKDVLAGEGDGEKLLAACRAQWQAFGMTKEEAKAIVETWKPDLLNKVGFLVAARVPAEVYDKILPLTISPRPGETVRAGVVFDTLPEERAQLAWLPTLERTLEKLVKGLDAEKPEPRQEASARLAALGDPARLYLEKLIAESPSPAVRAAARTMLDKLAPGILELPVHGRGSQPVNLKR